MKCTWRWSDDAAFLTSHHTHLMKKRKEKYFTVWVMLTISTPAAVLADMTYGTANKADRALSPGTMGEEERRELIARQRSALYGEGPFAETPGYVDETGNTRPGIPSQNGPAAAALRGRSPLAYDYGRVPQPLNMSQEPGPQPAVGTDPSQAAAQNERSRANSSSSPQSNPPAGMGKFDGTTAQQTAAARTSSSSPGGSPPRQGGGPPGSKPTQPGSVAPIGTRPSATSQTPPNPALTKRSTTPLPSPLSQVGAGYKPGAPGSGSVSAGGAGSGDDSATGTAPTSGTGAGSNPASATTEMGGGWNGSRSAGGVWGSANKSGLGAVWG